MPIGFRTDPVAGELVDRDHTVQFVFDGQRCSGHPGDTIASALTAAGVGMLSRSFKYHRPRGLMCCSGACPNCLVQVADEPNVRACQRQLEEGMEVRSQNVWPSLKRDLLSWLGRASRFMPVGFYYKTFIRPAILWPLFERILRHAAGLGTVDTRSRSGPYQKEYLHVDTAVVGGGPAGMSAALAAAARGASVLLLDNQPELGGHWRYTAGVVAAELRTQITGQERIRVSTDTEVIGLYLGNWLAARAPDRLLKIRSRSVVLACGVRENPLIFDNNDLPGILLGSATERLLHLYGVAPGKRALVVTANDDGWRVAADLRRAGVEIVAVADERAVAESPAAAALETAGTRCFYRHAIVQARGRMSVTGARLAALDVDGNADFNSVTELSCDLVVVSVGWTPALELLHMAGGATRYDDQRCEFAVSNLPPGVFVAGRANGGHGPEWQQLDGTHAGLSAAASCGYGDSEAVERERPAPPTEPRRASPRVVVPGGKKRFLCLCEDVTNQDLETAMAEGYDSIELLKRYSTVSMGPCQGKFCSANAIHLCARVGGRTVAETGRTTARPPVSPVSLGVLAGQRMEPVRLGALHEWHLERGAKMMVAGTWLRPEHYGDPAAEVRNVRERVGIIDVSTLGKYRLSGAGVPRFLERIYVNQWRKLEVGRVRYGLMCNDEGVVMDDGVCAHIEPTEWYMSTTSSGASGVAEWLQWWMQSGWGDGVHLVDLTDLYAAFNLAGPDSRQVLQKLTEFDLGNENLPYMCTRSIVVAGVPCRVLRIGFTGELSYELHCPSGHARHIWDRIMEAGVEHSIRPFGVEAQRILRLEKGHIIVGQDTDAVSDALSANMAWAVKLKKRDFLGKHELSRVAEEGSRQLLVGYKMTSAGATPEEGMQIVERTGSGAFKNVGWITSSRFSPTLGESIGLCWLPREQAEREGSTFQVYMDGNCEEARVFHGAFYDPQGERIRS